MARRTVSPPTLAVQRLCSAHGRLVNAAWRIPSRNRHLTLPSGRWTAIEVLSHLLEFQEEAVRRCISPVAASVRQPLSDCAGRVTRGLRRDSWEALMERLEIGHHDLCRRIREEPPDWFGQLTYEHYAYHQADFEASPPSTRRTEMKSIRL